MEKEDKNKGDCGAVRPISVRLICTPLIIFLYDCPSAQPLCDLKVAKGHLEDVSGSMASQSEDSGQGLVSLE